MLMRTTMTSTVAGRPIPALEYAVASPPVRWMLAGEIGGRSGGTGGCD